MDAAIQAIGFLGKAYSLPIPAEGDNKYNKKAIVETLFSVLSNAKLSTKVYISKYFINYTKGKEKRGKKKMENVCMCNHNLFLLFLDERKGCAFFGIFMRRRVFPAHCGYRK